MMHPNSRINSLETSTNECHTELETIKHSLGSSEAREQALMTELEAARREAQKIVKIEALLEDARKEVDRRAEMYVLC